MLILIYMNDINHGYIYYSFFIDKINGYIFFFEGSNNGYIFFKKINNDYIIK